MNAQQEHRSIRSSRLAGTWGIAAVTVLAPVAIFWSATSASAVQTHLSA